MTADKHDCRDGAWSYVRDDLGVRVLTRVGLVGMVLFTCLSIVYGYMFTGASWAGLVLGILGGLLAVGIIDLLLAAMSAGMLADRKLDQMDRARFLFVFLLYTGGAVVIAWSILTGPPVLEVVIIGLVLIAGILYMFPAAAVTQLKTRSWRDAIAVSRLFHYVKQQEYRMYCGGSFALLTLGTAAGAGICWRVFRVGLEVRQASTSFMPLDPVAYMIAVLLPLWVLCMLVLLLASGYLWGRVVSSIMEGSSPH